MNANSRRISLLRHPIFFPAAALLGWGCALPYVSAVDAFALTFPLSALLGIYGTQFMVLFFAASLATAPIAIAWFVLDRITDSRLSDAMRVPWTIGATLFFLMFFYAVRTVAMSWVAKWGLAIPLTIWLTATLPLSLLLSLYARGLFDNLLGFSWLLALAGALCLPFAFVEPDSTPNPAASRLGRSRPDILLVTLDALSARQMSLYGALQHTTPNIDRLARNAIVFDRAYAGANFTTAGINTLLTGRYPDQHRALQLGARALPRFRATSLPAMLKQQGYRTTYVSTNSYAAPWRNGYAPYFDTGVDDATRWRPSLCEDGWLRWFPYGCDLNNPFLNIALAHFTDNGAGNLEYDGPMVIAAARRVVTMDRRPQFLWTHLIPPHDPYAAPPGCLGRFYRGPEYRTASSTQPIYGIRPRDVPIRHTRLLEQRYRESLWCADATVAAIVDTFRTRDKPFVLIITADHGESFTPWLTGHGGPYLNEDSIRIPLIVALPGMTRERRSHVVASQVDVLPIVRKILDGADADAIDTLIRGRRAREPALAMTYIDNPRLGRLTSGSIAAIGDGAKYIRYLSQPGPFVGLKEQYVGGGAAKSPEWNRLRGALSSRLANYGGSAAR